MSRRPGGPGSPRIPLFLLATSGRPLVWNQETTKAIIAYSSGPLAVAAARLMQERGFKEIGILSVSTSERMAQVVAQLARHGVQSMIWDYMGNSVFDVVDLGTLI